MTTIIILGIAAVIFWLLACFVAYQWGFNKGLEKMHLVTMREFDRAIEEMITDFQMREITRK